MHAAYRELCNNIQLKRGGYYDLPLWHLYVTIIQCLKPWVEDNSMSRSLSGLTKDEKSCQVQQQTALQIYLKSVDPNKLLTLRCISFHPRRTAQNWRLQSVSPPSIFFLFFGHLFDLGSRQSSEATMTPTDTRRPPPPDDEYRLFSSVACFGRTFALHSLLLLTLNMICMGQLIQSPKPANNFFRTYIPEICLGHLLTYCPLMFVPY